MKTVRILTAAVVLQFVLIGYLALYTGQSTAMAQIPDQGAQLQQLIEESKALNAKMDRLITMLEGGKLKVTVEQHNAK